MDSSPKGQTSLQDLSQRLSELEKIILERYLKQPGDWIGKPPYHGDESVDVKPKDDPDRTFKDELTSSPHFIFPDARRKNPLRAGRFKKEKKDKKEEVVDLSEGFERRTASVANVQEEPPSRIEAQKDPSGVLNSHQDDLQPTGPNQSLSDEITTIDNPDHIANGVRQPPVDAPPVIIVKEEEVDDLWAQAEEPIYVGRSGDSQPHTWPDVKVKVKK